MGTTRPFVKVTVDGTDAFTRTLEIQDAGVCEWDEGPWLFEVAQSSSCALFEVFDAGNCEEHLGFASLPIACAPTDPEKSAIRCSLLTFFSPFLLPSPTRPNVGELEIEVLFMRGRIKEDDTIQAERGRMTE